MYVSGTAEMHYMYSFVYHSRSTFHLYHIHPRLRCLCSWQKCRIFLFFKILDAEVELLIFKETLTQGYLFQREREREKERERERERSTGCLLYAHEPGVKPMA